MFFQIYMPGDGHAWLVLRRRRLCEKNPTPHTVFTFFNAAFCTQALRLSLSSSLFSKHAEYEEAFLLPVIHSLSESCSYYLQLVQWKQIHVQRRRHGRKLILELGLNLYNKASYISHSTRPATVEARVWVTEHFRNDFQTQIKSHI